MEHYKMRYPIASLLFILIATVCSATKPNSLEPIQIAAYDMSGNDSLLATSITGDSLELPTFSGVLSDWHTVVPPVRMSPSENTDNFTIWSPENETTSEKWILITYKDQNTDEQRVRAFPAESLIRNESTLFLVNLTSLELKGLSNGGEVRLKPNGLTFLDNPRSNVSVRLTATESPHYTQVSLSDLDTDQSFLLIFSYPHIQGSALLSYRLIHFANLK